MNIFVNGKSAELSPNTSIVMLLNQYSVSGPMTIIEVNHSVIAKPDWSDHLLQEGDKVEIIQLMGGG